MSVSIVVPLREVDDRGASWAWLRVRYETLFPEWELIESDVPGPWSKGAALNAGVARASGDVLVLADADCVATASALRTAVEELDGWTVPFGEVYRLGCDFTGNILAGNVTRDPAPVGKLERDPARPPYKGKPGGGIVVVSRSSYAAVGGMDERFLGWGGEDYALGDALTTCIGRPRRVDLPLWHLWHEPAPDYDPSGRFPAENTRLRKRYRAARHDVPTMRGLIAERTGEDAVGCGCGARPPGSEAPRAEASCLTCGLSFTSYAGPDGAQVHKDRSGHVLRGLRGLRASERRGEPSDQFTGAGV